MRSPAVLLAAVVLAVAAASARAQCPNVTFQPYGTGCNPAGFDVPVLKGSYDPGLCTITLSWNGLPGCCNSFLTGRLLFLGLQQAAIPAPPPGAGCTLLVDPLVVAFLPPGATTLTAPVPISPLPVVLKVHAQIVNEYTTFGIVKDYNFSNGLTIVKP